MFVPRTPVNRCQITGDVQVRVLLPLSRECDFVANFRGNFGTFGELELESLVYRRLDGGQDFNRFAQNHMAQNSANVMDAI